MIEDPNYMWINRINLYRTVNATALVNMSAMFSSEGTYKTLIMCLLQRYLRW